MPAHPQPAANNQLVRVMGRWTLAALVINSIIGSGIFGLPSTIAGMLGPWSPHAWLIAAAGNGVIMLCFAEVASRFSEAGGAYLYARESLGRFVGIQIGWMAYLTRISAAAAGANLFTLSLGEYFPATREGLIRIALLTALLGFLAIVNYRGVSGGAKLSNIFTVSKLAPLLLFVVAGGFFLAFGREFTPAPNAGPTTLQWLDAVLLMAFAYGGYDGAMMAMGEAKDPRRNVPFALITAMIALAALFALIQWLVITLAPDAASAPRPLAAAARVFWGEGGALLMVAGAMISVYGFLSANVLNAPRLTYALAKRGDFPRWFGLVHERFRTPYISILSFTFLVWLLAARGNFQWNATLSAVSRLFVYGSVCVSLLSLRRQNPAGALFRLRGGVFFALLGIAFCGILLSRMGKVEFYIVAAIAAIATLNWAVATKTSKANP